MTGYSWLTAVSSTLLAAVLLSLALPSIMGLLRLGKRWKPEGKHVFVTGGSQGLGLALAELLAAKGAHVTVCSRTEPKLREAVDKVKVSIAAPISPI